MKVWNSKSFEFSHNDILKMIWMWITALAGFYAANTELINSILENRLSDSEFALVTAFLYYIVDKFATDNSK